MQKAKEYFDEEYGTNHIKEVVEMGDIVSIYGLMEEYAEKILKALRKNDVVGQGEQFTCDCGFATDDSFKWSVHPLNCALFDD
jgi:hypothetical protein